MVEEGKYGASMAILQRYLTTDDRGRERERERHLVFHLFSVVLSPSLSPSNSPSPSPSPPPSVKLALLSRVKEVRAGAMRVLRYTLSSSHVYEIMLHFKIDHLVARSLDSPPQRDIERLQAMRFVRQVSQYNFGHFQ